MIQRPGRLSRIFRETLAATGVPRLVMLIPGLGVISNSEASYYPMDRIRLKGEKEDAWRQGVLMIQCSVADGVPGGHWKGSPDRPMQLLRRRCGFSLTHLDCKVYRLIPG
jgi:hypothetical protein